MGYPTQVRSAFRFSQPLSGFLSLAATGSISHRIRLWVFPFRGFPSRRTGKPLDCHPFLPSPTDNPRASSRAPRERPRDAQPPQQAPTCLHRCATMRRQRSMKTKRTPVPRSRQSALLRPSRQWPKRSTGEIGNRARTDRVPVLPRSPRRTNRRRYSLRACNSASQRSGPRSDTRSAGDTRGAYKATIREGFGSLCETCVAPNERPYRRAQAPAAELSVRVSKPRFSRGTLRGRLQNPPRIRRRDRLPKQAAPIGFCAARGRTRSSVDL